MISMDLSGIKTRHLYNRAAFGLPLATDAKGKFPSLEKSLEILFKDSAVIVPIKLLDANPMKREELKTMTPEDKKALRKSAPILLKELNHLWITKIASGDQSLREKITLFWANHFSCRNGNPYYTQELNNSIRENALGNFKELLKVVSKSAAMLQFLNNQQNRKFKPNENFAREVMELFTLGRGNYSEKDIKEAARAFTGWGFDDNGVFTFRERIHDNDSKTIFGKTGNFNGEEVLNIITDRPECAQFIAAKMYKAFVNDQPDPIRIKELGQVLYENKYDLTKTFSYLFLADWMYDAKNIGCLIKSPVELMVPLMRDFKVQFASDTVTLGFQRILGQVLFNPPNVAGWPGGRNWIDSSSLAFRLKLPSVMLADVVEDIHPKDEGDINNALASGSGTVGRSRCEANWSTVLNKFGTTPDGDLFPQLQFLLLATVDGGPPLAFADQFFNRTNHDTLIRSTILYLMSLPEYQLC